MVLPPSLYAAKAVYRIRSASRDCGAGAGSAGEHSEASSATAQYPTCGASRLTQRLSSCPMPREQKVVQLGQFAHNSLLSVMATVGKRAGPSREATSGVIDGSFLGGGPCHDQPRPPPNTHPSLRPRPTAVGSILNTSENKDLRSVGV